MKSAISDVVSGAASLELIVFVKERQNFLANLMVTMGKFWLFGLRSAERVSTGLRVICVLENVPNDNWPGADYNLLVDSNARLGWQAKKGTSCFHLSV